MLAPEIRTFIEDDIKQRFLSYVQVHTTSDPNSTTKPSTERQFDLLEILKKELEQFGLQDIELSRDGYVYATLPSNLSGERREFGLMAHVDTSPDQSGENVKPICHENWDGSPITYPDDPNLTLTVADSEELKDFMHQTIITASGKTLLGADDKAGVAEIMTAIATFQKFSQLPHGPIRLCFTTDEEIGHGTDKLDFTKIPRYLYTMDGGYPGELESECFDAWGVEVEFQGRGVHPGYAYGKMINALRVASLFIAELPADQRPETTKDREGFFHVSELNGNNESAKLRMIIRDFEADNNTARVAFLEQLKTRFEADFPGLTINLTATQQYKNMRDDIQQHQFVVDLAEEAIKDTGIPVIKKSIRGGTDGSSLTEKGHPTPNIYAGGMLFHSRREYVALSSMVNAVETIIHLAKRWGDLQP